MVEVLAAAGPLRGEAAARCRRALDQLRPPAPLDLDEAEARLARLLARTEPALVADL
jgi:hypothetical protein